jgi:hypothetical protein
LARECVGGVGGRVGSWIAVEQIMQANPRATALPAPSSSPGVNAHYETENRRVWNDEKHADEEHEFVYEVSWLPELGVWRRFLRTHRKA